MLIAKIAAVVLLVLSFLSFLCFIGEEAYFFRKTVNSKEKPSFEKATDPAGIITLIEFLLAFIAAFCGAAVCFLGGEPNRFRVCLTGGVVGRAVGAVIGIIYYYGFKDTTLQTLYPEEMEKNRHASSKQNIGFGFVAPFAIGFAVLGILICVWIPLA